MGDGRFCGPERIVDPAKSGHLNNIRHYVKLSILGNKSHLRRTSNKRQPSALTIHRLQESMVWKMEQEFYEFAREQFHFIRRRLFSSRDEQKLESVKQQFMFEKIRPR